MVLAFDGQPFLDEIPQSRKDQQHRRWPIRKTILPSEFLDRKQRAGIEQVFQGHDLVHLQRNRQVCKDPIGCFAPDQCAFAQPVPVSDESECPLPIREDRLVRRMEARIAGLLGR